MTIQWRTHVRYLSDSEISLLIMISEVCVGERDGTIEHKRKRELSKVVSAENPLCPTGF